MKTTIIIGLSILLILLVGCKETIIEYQNQTVEVIKECPLVTYPDCICNYNESICGDCICDKPEVIEKQVIPSSCTTCKSKLSHCQTQSQYYSDSLADYLINNETRAIENVTFELDKCRDDLKEVNSTLTDILKLLD